jgi:hypothetical protein
LFEFLVRDFGYSPGAAMRRIDGARLLRELPDVQNKIESGTLTLSQANQIQRAAREMKKTERFLSTEEKQEMILQLEHASKKETETIIAKRLNLPVTHTQKQTLHRDASVTLTMTFSAEQIEVLEQVRHMTSHSVSGQSWSELFMYLAEKELARRTKMKSKSLTNSLNDSVKTTVKEKIINTPSAATIESETLHCTSVATVKTKTKNRTVAATVNERIAIPTNIRKTLLTKNARCQFKNHKGEPCNSPRYLQIDHIQSLSQGGGNEIENLQVLCGTHNRYKYATGG